MVHLHQACARPVESTSIAKLAVYAHSSVGALISLNQAALVNVADDLAHVEAGPRSIIILRKLNHGLSLRESSTEGDCLISKISARGYLIPSSSGLNAAPRGRSGS